LLAVRVAVAIEKAAAHGGNRDDVGLLVGGLRRELRALDALQPEGAAGDDQEAEEEGGEEESDPSLDRSHRPAP